ncbi:MAG: ABC transporter permease [Candidatus Latescibacteria bacterium]|nr:ABC transporter permease [Candidatus Latescibacterota bacterium]
MFKNHITVAIRTLLRHKIYSFVNISGLAVGIACCMLIMLFVQDELSYDQFHKNADRIYRVLWNGRYGDNEWTIPYVEVPISETLKERFPEVTYSTRLRRESQTIRRESNYVIEKNFYYTESSFFDVFTVPFIAGDPTTALNAPNAVILTKQSAQRYFPDRDPMGQTLELNDGKSLQVTGVVKAFPPQSHFHFDFLAPLKTLPIIERRKSAWGSATVYTYLVLKDGASASELQTKFTTYVREHILSKMPPMPGYHTNYLIQPLTDIHLHSNLRYEITANSNIMYVYIFSFIAIFVLLLACINFVNLSTARSSTRAREVGVRKVLGSHRSQLIRQFFSESTICVAFSSILAIGLCELGLPLLNSLANKHLTMGSLIAPHVLIGLFALIIVVGLLSGMYPALYLSSFWPVTALKGYISSGKAYLRNGLVIAQFCISISLLVGTLVVRDQLHFAQNKHLGFDKEHVLIIRGIPRTLASASPRQAMTFRDQFETLPQVAIASLNTGAPGHDFDSMLFVPEQPANYEKTSLTYTLVDEKYVEALNIEILEGRNFSPTEHATDVSAFLVNQSAVKALGWQTALGKKLKRGSGTEGSIIGVVSDFHIGSLKQEIEPLVLPYLYRLPMYLAIRLHPDNVAEAIAAVEETWKKLAPNQPFSYTFLDQDYARLYNREQQMSHVFQIFSGLAILIACLGLFGLAAFTTQQRTKEIGIRKILGASVSGIIYLLSKDFLKLVIIANIIAWPIAYYAMNQWLQGFAYRIDLGIGTFILSGLIALLIAILTVSYQAIKAARANPVEALRYE